MKANEKVHDNGWNGKRSLRKASSVGDSHTLKDKFKRNLMQVRVFVRKLASEANAFEQGKRFLPWNPVIGLYHIRNAL
jgi:hypothetical protein